MHPLKEARKQEKSLQGLLMEISREYMGKGFYQIKELGIYPGQVPILNVLNRRDGYSQRELAELLGVKPPTVTVSINRLEKSGILCRKQDENDQRVTRIYLTDKGREAIQQAMSLVKKMEDAVFGDFSEAELVQMRQFFQQILSNIEAIPGPTEEECRMMAQHRPPIPGL